MNKHINRSAWLISFVFCLLWQQPVVAMDFAAAALRGFGEAAGEVAQGVGKVAGNAYQYANRTAKINEGILEIAESNKARLEQALKQNKTEISGLKALIAAKADYTGIREYVEVPRRTQPFMEHDTGYIHITGNNWIAPGQSIDDAVEVYNRDHSHTIEKNSDGIWLLPLGMAYEAKDGDVIFDQRYAPSHALGDSRFKNVAPIYSNDSDLRRNAVDVNGRTEGGMHLLNPTKKESEYTEGDYNPEPVFSKRTVTLHSTEEIEEALAMMTTLVDRYTKKVEADKEGAFDAKEASNKAIEGHFAAEGQAKAARESAMIQAKASRENMERMLKASPALALLGLGTFAGGLALKQVLPRLLGQKPQVISEMSFRTPLEKLLGKKLPQGNIEKVIWAPKTGEKIMRFTRRIQRVIQKGGELMNMIFYGPPGTGKTMTAKAVARASGAEYMIINGAAFEQLPPSKIIMELEGVFRMARTSKKPVLIFWDEADAALGKRGGEMESLASRRLINTFLSNVSDTHNSKIMFILATNLPSTLDDAVLSRFPQEGWIFFDRPELAERAKILRMYLHDFLSAQGLELGQDTDNEMTSFAEQLNTATGRDLRALARGVYDRMMDDDVSALNPALVRKVISETQENRNQIGQYVYGQ